MPCCRTSCTWVYNLRVGQENRPYTVQLIREISCCNERYQLFVNGEEHVGHSLKYNFCSPLCCSGGRYAWEQDGHHFLLMYNSLSFTKSLGSYRLFIDGIDVNTGREFSAFWRRKGLQIIVLGLVFLLIGAGMIVVVIFTFFGGYILEFLGYILALNGITYIVLGTIPLIKYRNTSARAEQYSPHFV